MPDSYESLLQAIGFPAADAANQFSLIDRKLQQGQSDIGRQGELDRRSVLSGQEGNGVLASGETGLKIADQAAAQASQSSNLSLSAADDVSSVQRGINQASAQAEAQRRALEQQKAMFDANQQQAQNQLTAQIALSNTPAQAFNPYDFLSSFANQGADPGATPQYRKNGGY